MKNKLSLRTLFTASIVAVLFLSHVGVAGAAIEPPDLEHKKGVLKKLEWKVMNILLDTYGATDWSQVTDNLTSFPDDAGNPNVMVIPLSLGNVFLNRYEATGDLADYERAVQHFEWVTKKYDGWGKRWLTPGVVHYLVVSVHRLREVCDVSLELPRVSRKRIGVLWKKVLRLLKAEADFRLIVDLPYAPYDSCFTGDSKAEENAWEATLFAAAANFLPDDAQAPAWDGKARQLAYDSITRPSDLPDKFGVKTCTVEEDLTLANHGLSPNPYYAGATLFLLTQGALTYRLTGRSIPEEFTHNLQEFYEKYTSYVSGDLSWLVPADPEGDATLFPLSFDPKLENEAVKLKAIRGFLWKPTKPVPVMSTGSELWEAIQNSKVVLYYLMGSYLWRFPPQSPCFDVRFEMPAEGEVQ
jgi:hypothetical protein